jgi:cytochrome c-type biogenesis protein CcmE
MKKTHIAALLVIAIAVAVLITAAGDYSSYSSFKDVMEKPTETHQIIGHLVTTKEVVYDPAKDPNYFSFWMKDENGVEKQIIYKGAKPQDFERSEQIVLTGKLENDAFVASQLLLKCPSKYKDKEVKYNSTQQK